MKQDIFKLVEQRNITLIIDTLREPNSYEFINMFNKECYTPIGYAIAQQQKYSSKDTEKLVYDTIITILLAFGSGIILRATKDNKIIKMDKDVHSLFNALYKKIYSEEELPDIKKAIGKKVLECINNAFILNEVDSLKSKYVLAIFKHNKNSAIGIFSRGLIFYNTTEGPKFDDEIQWEHICNWYLTSVYYEKSLRFKINGKLPFVIFFEYMQELSTKPMKSKFLQSFSEAITCNILLIARYGLLASNYISCFLCQEDQVANTSASRSKKKKKKKKIKDSTIIAINKDFFDKESEKMATLSGLDSCNFFLWITYVLKTTVKSKEIYSAAFDQLSIILNLKIDKNNSYELKSSPKLLVDFWNNCIKTLVVSNQQYFDKAESKSSEEFQVQGFIEMAMLHFDLSFNEILAKANKLFENQNIIANKNFTLYGSQVTKIVCQLFGIEFDAYNQANFNILYIKRDLSAHKVFQDKSGHFTMDFEGNRFSFTDKSSVSFLDYDTLKSFCISLNDGCLAISSYSLLHLLKGYRIYDLRNLTSNRLAYFMREAANNPPHIKISDEFIEYLKDAANKLTVQKAIAMFLTKYASDTKPKLLDYFHKNLSRFISFFAIEEKLHANIIEQISNIRERAGLSELSDRGINYFAAIYIALIKVCQEKIASKETELARLFPGSIFFSEILALKAQEESKETSDMQNQSVQSRISNAFVNLNIKEFSR